MLPISTMCDRTGILDTELIANRIRKTVAHESSPARTLRAVKLAPRDFLIHISNMDIAEFSFGTDTPPVVR